MKFDGHELQKEQLNCLAQFSTLDSDQSLGIFAGAGSSKTYTCRAIAQLIVPHSRILFLAFGRVPAQDARRQFPSYVDVTTTHGLAASYIGKRYSGRLEGRLTPKMLAEKLNLTNYMFGMAAVDLCKYILLGLRNYYMSSERNLCSNHIPELDSNLPIDQQAALVTKLVELSQVTFDMLCTTGCKLPVTHDFYLKVFVNEFEDTSMELPYQTVMLDEAQDTSPCVSKLVSLIRGARKVMVGDKYQSIFEWRGAVNSMDEMQITKTASLTTCFRFGESIAELANALLNNNGFSGVKFQGNKQKHTEIVTHIDSSFSEQELVLCRTNATIMSELIAAHDNERTACLLKKDSAKDLLKLVKDIEHLKQGNRVTNSTLSAFETWADVREHSKSGLGADLAPIIRSVDNYGVEKLKQIYSRAKNTDTTSASTILATGHSAKGAEAKNVRLAGDFDRMFMSSDESTRQSEAKLLYVALTRVIGRLDISQCKTLRDIITDTKHTKSVTNTFEASVVNQKTSKKKAAFDALFK